MTPDGRCTIIADVDGEYVDGRAECTYTTIAICEDEHGDRQINAVHNARLIAAAPDLLAALIQMEKEKAEYMRINKLGDPAKEHTNKVARAAIAKAAGQ